MLGLDDENDNFAGDDLLIGGDEQWVGGQGGMADDEEDKMFLDDDDGIQDIGNEIDEELVRGDIILNPTITVDDTEPDNSLF